MKFCYANRRMTLYPNSVDPWDLAPEDYTDQFLKKVKNIVYGVTSCKYFPIESVSFTGLSKNILLWTLSEHIL